MNYKIEVSENNNGYLEIHIDKRISKTIVMFNDMESIKYTEATPKQKELANKLFQIKGVCEVFIDQYSISIVKSPMFKWEKLIPLLVKRINASVSPKEEAVKV